MLLTEWDTEEAKVVWREEGFEDGLKEFIMNCNSSPKARKIISHHSYNIFPLFFCLILFFSGCPDKIEYKEKDLPVTYSYTDTGLPVIYIYTANGAPIVSRETWVNMKMNVVSDNPAHSFEKKAGNDQIRGRGNSTWGYDKKPYRIRFRESTSMFGLAPSRNWVLLANWKDGTMIANTVTFELGRRFDGPLFKNNYVHVELVLNGNHMGNYLLTEHMRVEPGRVDINPDTDYLVELDNWYDEDPKFETTYLKLPVMITWPDLGSNINNSGYKFVIDSLNKLDIALSDSRFPNNNWKDLVNIDTLVDFIMINEIVRNRELRHPKSTYVCSQNGIIRMSHLWDFDWAFGMEYISSVDLSKAKERYKGGWFFERFFLDPEFSAKYKTRWIQKYDVIKSMPDFIDEMYNKLRLSADLNIDLWQTFSYRNEINKLKTWWIDRVEYLDSEIRKD